MPAYNGRLWGMNQKNRSANGKSPLLITYIYPQKFHTYATEKKVIRPTL